jgi:hypothetical protein
MEYGWIGQVVEAEDLSGVKLDLYPATVEFNSGVVLGTDFRVVVENGYSTYERNLWSGSHYNRLLTKLLDFRDEGEGNEVYWVQDVVTTYRIYLTEKGDE